MNTNGKQCFAFYSSSEDCQFPFMGTLKAIAFFSRIFNNPNTNTDDKNIRLVWHKSKRISTDMLLLFLSSWCSSDLVSRHHVKIDRVYLCKIFMRMGKKKKNQQ